MVNKNIKSLIVSILSLLILLILLKIPAVHAGEVNGTGTDGSAATETGIVGGWADWKSGLRIYVVNESNTSKSPLIKKFTSKEFSKYEYQKNIHNIRPLGFDTFSINWM